MADLHLRHAYRFEIVTSVSYSWSSLRGQVCSGEGETRNMSDSGILVVGDQCPPIGALIQISMRLPSPRGKPFGMKLYGEGRVVRSEKIETSPGNTPSTLFAASMHFYPETSEKSEQPLESCNEGLKSTVQ